MPRVATPLLAAFTLFTVIPRVAAQADRPRVWENELPMFYLEDVEVHPSPATEEFRELVARSWVATSASVDGDQTYYFDPKIQALYEDPAGTLGTLWTEIESTRTALVSEPQDRRLRFYLDNLLPLLRLFVARRNVALAIECYSVGPDVCENVLFRLTGGLSFAPVPLNLDPEAALGTQERWRKWYAKNGARL